MSKEKIVAQITDLMEKLARDHNTQGQLIFLDVTNVDNPETFGVANTIDTRYAAILNTDATLYLLNDADSEAYNAVLMATLIDSVEKQVEEGENQA